MKKILLGVVLVLATMSSQAAYLYWQVNSDSLGAIDSQQTHTFNIYATNGSDTYALTSYKYTWDVGEGAGSYGSVSSPVSSSDAAGGLYADLTTYDPNTSANVDTYNEGYSYYIEVTGYNSANGQDGWVNRSQTLAYANASGHITTTLSSMATIPTAWTGGTFSAPEPTGAMLLLVGGALLALKRKRV